jgi:predicted transcriptional regulator of viral defense system
MAKHPVFTIEDVNLFYDNMNSARSAVKRMLAASKVQKIRNNLYTCISAENGSPVANRFQIASAISKTSYVSHHSAMEYYGVSDQVFYDVYVSSETKFRNFDFDGYTYHFVKANLDEGIETPAFSGGIRITDRERTLTDCIKDMDRIGGIEETVAIIDCLHNVSENKILYYLSLYKNQFLYQKCGFLLWHCRDTLGLTEHFFSVCREHIGKSKRYLTADMTKGVYIGEWNLVVPSDLLYMKNGEGSMNAAI